MSLTVCGLAECVFWLVCSLRHGGGHWMVLSVCFGVTVRVPDGITTSLDTHIHTYKDFFWSQLILTISP